MIPVLSISRAKGRLALLLAAMLAALMVGGASAGATARHGNAAQAAARPLTRLERGTSANAEAAIDSMARALSREHGYDPSRLSVELYGGPASQGDMAAVFSEMFDLSDWAAAPELASSGAGYHSLGWTRANGQQAMLGGYGPDGESDQFFVVVIRAAR